MIYDEPTAWEEWIRFVSTRRIDHGMRDTVPDHIKTQLPDLFPEVAPKIDQVYNKGTANKE